MFEFREKSKLQKFSTNLSFSAGRPTSSTPTPYYSNEHIQDNALRVIFLKKPPKIYEKVRAHPDVLQRVFRITLLASTDVNDALRVINQPAKGLSLLAAGDKPSTWLPPGRPRGSSEQFYSKIT